MQCTAMVDLQAAQALVACPMQRVRHIVERRCECLSVYALCMLSALRHNWFSDMYACMEPKHIVIRCLIALSCVRQVPWRTAVPRYQRAPCRQHVKHLVVVVVRLAVLLAQAASMGSAFVFHSHGMRLAQGV